MQLKEFKKKEFQNTDQNRILKRIYAIERIQNVDDERQWRKREIYPSMHNKSEDKGGRNNKKEQRPT